MTSFSLRGRNRANGLCHAGLTRVIPNEGEISLVVFADWCGVGIGLGFARKGERKDLPFAHCVPGVLIQSEFFPIITQRDSLLILIFSTWKVLSVREVQRPAQGVPAARRRRAMGTLNPCVLRSRDSRLRTSHPRPWLPLLRVHQTKMGRQVYGNFKHTRE